MTLLKCLLTSLILFIALVPDLLAQDTPAYAVIDGTQNPPQVVSGNLDVAIADNGAGNYTLTFDSPVLFFLGTSQSQGPVFDAAPTFLSAIRDSSNKHKVNVKTFGIHPDATGGHVATDARFSIKVFSLPLLIFEDNFE